MTTKPQLADQMFAHLAQNAEREGSTGSPKDRNAEAERAAELLVAVYGVHALQKAEAVEGRARMAEFAAAVCKAVARRLTEFNRV